MKVLIEKLLFWLVPQLYEIVQLFDSFAMKRPPEVMIPQKANRRFVRENGLKLLKKTLVMGWFWIPREYLWF